MTPPIYSSGTWYVHKKVYILTALEPMGLIICKVTRQKWTFANSVVIFWILFNPGEIHIYKSHKPAKFGKRDSMNHKGALRIEHNENTTS